MRRMLRLASALCLAGTLMTACSSPGPTVTYTQYQLTCCSKVDIDQVWRPGTAVDLHWIVGTSITTTFEPTHKVINSAVLMGPFSDVTALKKASSAIHAVQGSVVTFDDRTPPPPDEVTTFYLPADLPPGFYQLNFKSDFGGGNSAGGGSVVRVGTE